MSRKDIAHAIVKEAIKQGISPDELAAPDIFGQSAWFKIPGKHNSISDAEKIIEKLSPTILHEQEKKTYNASSWFNEVDDIIEYNGNTYLFNKNHGGKNFEQQIDRIFTKFPQLKGSI